MKKSLNVCIMLMLCISMSMVNLYAKGKAEVEDTSIPVQVDAKTTLAEVSPYLINGFNLNNEMQVFTIKKLIDELNITTITYPAGNVGDERDLLSEYELTYFKSQQEYVGTPFTFVQARLFEGTPEQAAEAVLTAKKVGIRVDAWTIGNEPDLYGPKRWDESWTPEKYNRRFREFAEVMRAVDPDIKLAGPATSQPVDHWIKSFIYECGDLVDYLIWHWYPSDGRGSDEAALATASRAYTMINTYKTWLKDPEVNPKGHNRDIKTGITEWAIHWDTDKFRQISDMTGVLWSAEVIGIYAELGIDYSHYFCLNRFGGHALFNRIDKPRVLYHLFAMFADHYGPFVVPAQTGDPDLRVHASRYSDKEVTVFVINQNKEEEKEVGIIIDEFSRVKSVDAWELVQDKEKRYTGIPKERVRKTKKKGIVMVSPYSVTVIRIKG
jgi:hypothetical protein